MLFFLCHLISLTVLCLFFFTQNHAALFLPYDGAFWRQFAKFHFEWSVPTTKVILNSLQGLGGITLPINFWFSPASVVTFLLQGATPDPVLLYTCIALEFFMSMWFLAYALGASHRVIVYASWIGTLLVMPFVVPAFVNKFTFYLISGIVPVIIEQIVYSNVIIASLLLFRSTKSLAFAVLAFLVFIAFLVGFSGGVILIIPLLLVFILYVLSGRPFDHKGVDSSFFSLLGFAILAALPMVSSVALMLPTVPSFFNAELVLGRPSWVYISILFHNFFNLGGLSSVVFIAGIAGGVLAWRCASGLLRAVARIYVIYALALVAAGVLFTSVFTWYRGPSSLYFEWFTWPLIFIYASFLAEELLRRFGHRLLPMKLKAFVVRRRSALSVSSVLISPFLIFAVLFAVNAPKDVNALPFPPKVTPLVDTLISRCALKPGDSWRGSVASFTGVASADKGSSWPDIAGYDVTLWQKTGNDHRAMGLWWYGIPSLFTYNQYMNPEYYYLMTRLFASERDSQMRNIVVLTKPDARLLRLFGVRYILTNKELSAEQPVHLIQRYMPWDDLPNAAAKSSGRLPLLLYEIDRPNLGNYSPTRALVEATAVGSLARIQDAGFQPERSVVLLKAIEGALEEASDSAFIWGKDGITVRAKSKGRSLLLLPLQYSHCLKIESDKKTTAEEAPCLVRADLVMTGVLFSGQLDAKIRYNFGPFSQPFCRVQDYIEARQMQLGSDARSIDKRKGT